MLIHTINGLISLQNPLLKIDSFSFWKTYLWTLVQNEKMNFRMLSFQNSWLGSENLFVDSETWAFWSEEVSWIRKVLIRSNLIDLSSWFWTVVALNVCLVIWYHVVLSGDNCPTFWACVIITWHIGFTFLGIRLKSFTLPHMSVYL